MIWTFFVALTIVWGLAYAFGYSKGQRMAVLKLRILQALAHERAKNPTPWN
jgi:hypothetical protein